MRKAVGLIPTRFNSRRLPGKSLKMIGDLPLIIHTYRRTKMAKSLDDVFICCDTKEVYQVAKKYNAKVILTSTKHKQGGDRIFEAYKKLKNKFDQVVDIQGDEPLIDPFNINQVVKHHRKNKNFDIILPNLPTKFTTDPHIVRIIFNKKREVLYLTRSNTPYHFISTTDKIYKHLSVISFKPSALKSFADCKKSKLEQLEDIVKVAIDCGCSGIVATNTTVTRVGELSGDKNLQESGGLSGVPLRTTSTEFIKHIYRFTDGNFPIVGVGGIMNADDAWEKITAGASLLQAYSGFVFEGPSLGSSVVKGLSKKLKQHGLSRIEDAVGLMHRAE